MQDSQLASEATGALLAGRYRLGRLLGSGAVADVYRCLDARLGRIAAVKLFRPHDDSSSQRRYLHEARALAMMSHPGLVSVYDSGVDEGRPYLVMQFVDGGNLRQRITGGPLTLDEAVRIGTRLAEAVAHVHVHETVHRDIKPSNILLDTDAQPYLADFGIALLAEGTRLTGTDEIMGSAAYLAPEQVLGNEVGPPADVYTLGLVLLECLTGELEYAGPNRAEAALARLNRPPRIPPGLPGPLADLLRAMTTIDPAKRPTAARCADRLKALDNLDDISTSVIRSVIGPPAVRIAHERNRQWRLFALAGTLVVVMAIAGWMLTTRVLSSGGSGAAIPGVSGQQDQSGASHHGNAGSASPTGSRETVPVPIPAQVADENDGDNDDMTTTGNPNPDNAQPPGNTDPGTSTAGTTTTKTKPKKPPTTTKNPPPRPPKSGGSYSPTTTP